MLLTSAGHRPGQKAKSLELRAAMSWRGGGISEASGPPPTACWRYYNWFTAALIRWISRKQQTLLDIFNNSVPPRFDPLLLLEQVPAAQFRFPVQYVITRHSHDAGPSLRGAIVMPTTDSGV